MSNPHKQRYKNSALDSQELRRRREEEGVQLRKNKREEQLAKRRNVVLSPQEDESFPIVSINSVAKTAVISG